MNSGSLNAPELTPTDPPIMDTVSPGDEILTLKTTNEDLIRANGDLLAQLRDVQTQLAETQAQLGEAQDYALFDSLTHLRRRKFFMKELDDLFNIEQQGLVLGSSEQRTRIEMPDMSFVILDIDLFKTTVNDIYGHPVGDKVIERVAEIIRTSIRGSDLSARWGGEEFALALIGADKRISEEKANLIREKISQIVFNEFPKLKVTVSAGIADTRDFGKHFDDLYKAADAALYESKHKGRNHLTVASKPEEE